MSHYVFDKTYLATEVAGIPARRVVVATSNANEVQLPAGANAGDILGVSVEAQENSDGPIPVRKLGVALIEAGGVITPGEFVMIAGSTGRVATIPEAMGPTNVVGIAETAATQAGDLVEVFMNIHRGSF